MGELADCKACNEGVLMPFHTPDGYVIYFCNNCRSRFSGYAIEPSFEGSPVFSESARYTEPFLEEELAGPKVKEMYRTLLEEFPPEADNGNDCPYCGSELSEGSRYCCDCWLPTP
jgi:hypothetical protein